jgi:hypothetical protein
LWQDAAMPPRSHASRSFLSRTLLAVASTLTLVRGAWADDAGITGKDRAWWAFQPITVPAIPAGPEQHPIDAFVAAKLQAAGLGFAPEASRDILIRRLWLDLMGLPPPPEEIDRFCGDPDPDAFGKAVDRLLESPHYGERWARHWLDLVRYAESDGYKADDYRPEAWRYRDYVIASFNADKPWDRFIMEQLAGDEMLPGNPEALVATGYLRAGIYEYNNRDAAGQWDAILNDITDTTSDVFLGLGLQCARCHDHKFDPLLQTDYFQLKAFFAGLELPESAPAARPDEIAAWKQQETAWEQATASLRSQIEAIELPWREKARDEAIEKFPPETRALLTRDPATWTPAERPVASLAWRQITYEWARLDGKIKGADKERLTVLRRELAGFAHLRPAALPQALTVRNFGPDVPDTFIPGRERAGPVKPGFPRVLGVPEPMMSADHGSTGRRSALARWIASPENPLTARVLVNRIWQQHFGQGLSTTSSDFGRLGDPPSHPELLDWLAADFTKHGWKLKRLHRLMVTSRAWRQSSRSPHMEPAALADPANRLLWRWTTRRLDSEQIRDAIHSASGELELTPAGGPGSDFTKPRRAIYLKLLRNVREPVAEVFDAPQQFTSTPQRDTTTTALQSLFLANGRFLRERAEAMATALLARHGDNLASLISEAWLRTAGRLPDADSLEESLSFLSASSAIAVTDRAREAAYPTEPMPHRDGRAVVIAPETPSAGLSINSPPDLTGTDFTVEAVVLLRSIATEGDVRTIAASWDPSSSGNGWSLGVTGQQSRRKPQMPVLQLRSRLADGRSTTEAVFSDLQLQLDRSYYLAAAVHFGPAGEGTVTFSVKDLANDDEPLQTSVASHPLAGPLGLLPRLVLGNDTTAGRPWDGLIDEIRLHRGILPEDRILLRQPSPGPATAACWQFEPATGLRRDLVSGQESIAPPPDRPAEARAAAVTDFCHALLSSSAFLYME